MNLIRFPGVRCYLCTNASRTRDGSGKLGRRAPTATLPSEKAHSSQNNAREAGAHHRARDAFALIRTILQFKPDVRGDVPIFCIVKGYIKNLTVRQRHLLQQRAVWTWERTRRARCLRVRKHDAVSLIRAGTDLHAASRVAGNMRAAIFGKVPGVHGCTAGRATDSEIKRYLDFFRSRIVNAVGAAISIRRSLDEIKFASGRAQGETGLCEACT